MKRQKLVYDAHWLTIFGLTNSSGRSGIFFVCLNILHQLFKSQKFDIYVYVPENRVSDLDVIARRYFPNDQLRMLPLTLDEKISQYIREHICKLEEKRKKAKAKKNFFKKKLIKLKILLFKLLKIFFHTQINYKNKDFDIFLSPILAIPNEIATLENVKKYTILYDTIPLIFPQFASDWYNALIASLNSNDYYFAISASAKNDFLKYCPHLDANKITTIPLSTNLPYRPNKNLTTEIRKKYNIPTDKKYLFSLCSLEPRKNLIRTVRTFIQFIEKNKIDDLVFVLGGGAWAGFIERFEKEVPDYQKYKDKIIRAGYIDDDDMEVLYSNAEWFVYTSQYEGFGMPPLEAMACGTAVITSNNSSLPEVVGDAGQMIDWDSDEQHIAAYEKYYFDKEYCNEMAQKGLERSKLFSWERAVDIMIDAFEK